MLVVYVYVPTNTPRKAFFSVFQRFSTFFGVFLRFSYTTASSKTNKVNVPADNMVAGTKLDRVRTANRYLGSEEFRDRIYRTNIAGIRAHILYRYNLLCVKPVFFCTFHHRRYTHIHTGMLKVPCKAA